MSALKIYFDTNIYRYISAVKETKKVANLLRTYDCRLTVSEENLLETYAIKGYQARISEMDTIVQLGNEYSDVPESYRHALEVRREIRRLRPRWMTPAPAQGKIRAFLKNHQAHWNNARIGDLPSAEAYVMYSKDAELGVALVLENQKGIRTSVQKAPSNFELHLPDGTKTPLDVADAESFWRMECCSVWYAAIQSKSPVSRDYADWLSPYLRKDVFVEPSYLAFWRDEVDAEAVPLNRLTGLVNFYQMKQKITHGNAADQLHASCWLLNDIFFTADRGFHAALSETVLRHFPGRRLPVLIDRGDPSFVQQLEPLLGDAGSQN